MFQFAFDDNLADPDYAVNRNYNILAFRESENGALLEGIEQPGIAQPFFYPVSSNGSTLFVESIWRTAFVGFKVNINIVKTRTFSKV